MKHLLIFLFSAFSFSGYSQDVLKLSAGSQSPKASLVDMEWLKGYWKGNGLGGDCEELWMPAADNSMPGVFRYMKGGKLILTEYMTIEEKDQTLTIKLKHFGRDLNAWEEKDEWMSFPLVKIEGQTAYFDGLTYQRGGG